MRFKYQKCLIEDIQKGHFVKNCTKKLVLQLQALLTTETVEKANLHLQTLSVYYCFDPNNDAYLVMTYLVILFFKTNCAQTSNNFLDVAVTEKRLSNSIA